VADLATLRAIVRNQTLAESDDVSEANLNTFINQGLRELSVAFNWPWLQATDDIDVVADTQAYDLPSDYRKLFVVRDNDKRRTLRRITLDEALNLYGGDPPSGSDALQYYIWADQIYLLPVPDTTESAAYTVFYQKAVTALSSDLDVPEFASEYHLILTHYAIARVWEHEEEGEKAALADAIFASKVAQMAHYYMHREERNPLIFGDGGEGTLGTRANMPWLDGA
jgi:hypothetical protein